TDPPNPDANSAPLPSWRSAVLTAASAGFCSILRAITRYGSSVVSPVRWCLVGDELPHLPAQPRQHDAFDGREVARFELHAVAGAECRARDIAEQGKWVAILSNASAITISDSINYR